MTNFFGELTPDELAQQDQMIAHADKTNRTLLKTVFDALDKGTSRSEIVHVLLVNMKEFISADHAMVLLASALWEMGHALHEGDWT